MAEPLTSGLVETAGRAAGPLAGVRVLELGSLVAGPLAGRLLADLGAEVIKVEPPGAGDPLRQWGEMAGETSYWWFLHARNKKSVTCNLRHPRGQELVRALAARSQVLIENFRPGRLEAWELGWERLRELNPRLVMVRISGFGQSGPYRDRPGFGSVAEAMGGLRFLTGEPGRPSVRMGVSLGDSLAGLYAAFSALAALREAERSGRGQVVDVALTEAVLGVLDDVVVEYSGTGKVRQPMGSRIADAAPTNTYPCADGRWIVLGGNSDPIFRRLAEAIGRPDLAERPEYQTNAGRVEHVDELDAAIAAWTRTLPAAEALRRLEEAGVPAGPIYDARAIAEDPHYRAREAVVNVEVPELGRPLTMQGVLPKFSATPGSIRWTGPALGAHNREVWGGLLGLDEAEMEELAQEGVI